MFNFYECLAFVIKTLRAYIDDRTTDGFYYVVHYVKDTCYEGEFALPLHTNDLRLTTIVATGYDYDHGAWVEDIEEFVELRAKELVS